jgi:hypothetical protein
MSEPLTARELADIEQRAHRASGHTGLSSPCILDTIIDEDVPKLVAEVERLQVALQSIAASNPALVMYRQGEFKECLHCKYLIRTAKEALEPTDA